MLDLLVNPDNGHVTIVHDEKDRAPITRCWIHGRRLVLVGETNGQNAGDPAIDDAPVGAGRGQAGLRQYREVVGHLQQPLTQIIHSYRPDSVRVIRMEGFVIAADQSFPLSITT